MGPLSKFDKVLIGGYVLWMAAAILNPPWADFDPQSGHFINNAGEHYLFDSLPAETAQIHFSLLFYQLFAATTVFCLVFWGIRWLRNVIKK